MRPLALVAGGMTTPVGLDFASSCAAIRCGLHAAAATRFIDSEGEPLMACEVPDGHGTRGLEKLVRMAASAVRECLTAAAPAAAKDIPLVLCVAERTRPGRLPGLDEELHPAVQQELGATFHARSSVIAAGRAGVGAALRTAEALLYDANAPAVIVAGADGLVRAPTLSAFEERFRVLTPKNSNGFIPGEAAAAILLTRPRGADELLCVGLGQGTETATVESDEPLRADGLVQAIRAAFADGGCGYPDVDYRLSDANGEQHPFREAQLAMGRTLRGKMKPRFDLWTPADSVGEVGAAAGPIVLGVALAAARKGYAPGGGVLCHFGSDDGSRAALVARWSPPRRT